MKKNYNFYLFLFLFIIFSGNTILKAQDSHWSQYNSSPQNLNPAQTGLFDGDWRIAGNYRNQWASVANVPFNTYSFSGDRRLKTAKPRTYAPALGLLINSDKSGDSKLKSTQIYVSAAYIKKLNKDSTHFLSIGVQPGITNKNFNSTTISFDEQFDGSKYNPGLSSGENIPSNSLTYFDVGAGAAYYWQKTSRQKLNIGFSAFHLNKPKQSFYDNGSSKLDVKYNISGIAEIPLAERFGILPSVLYQRQGEHKELLMGLFGKYYFTNIDQLTTALSLGAFVRTKDAYAVMLNMEYQRFNVGLSYDVNYSKLTAATNNRGAFELSVVYIFKKTPTLIAKQRSYPMFM
jgi:type IX secretion system PorP/SprF family membrane protein